MAPTGLTNAAGQCYFFQIWGNGPEARVYNNIFGGAGPSTSLSDRIEQDEGVVTNNLFLPDDLDHLPFMAIPGNIDDFIASGGILGQLVSGSAARDAGTAAHPYPDEDYYHNLRSDGAPDIGAVEQ